VAGADSFGGLCADLLSAHPRKLPSGWAEQLDEELAAASAAVDAAVAAAAATVTL